MPRWITAVAWAACVGGSTDGPGDLEVPSGCATGEALAVDGGCTPIDPSREVFRIDGSDVTLRDDPSAGPSGGGVSAPDEAVAEACCIFAVANAPNFPIYQDAWGNFYFTGACELPVPWTPGAWGCGCVGANAVVDPYTGQSAPLFGNWLGFTCVVD